MTSINRYKGAFFNVNMYSQSPSLTWCHEEAQPPGGDQGGQSPEPLGCAGASLQEWGREGGEGALHVPARAWGVTEKGMPAETLWGTQPIPAAGSEAGGQCLGQ